jgi:hypothetical protein
MVAVASRGAGISCALPMLVCSAHDLNLQAGGTAEGQVFSGLRGVAAQWELAFPLLDGQRGVCGSGPGRAEHSNACTITPPSPQLIRLI